MAECIQFACSSCGKSIEAWSDGNPFYINETGNKQYAYHPNHDELEKCIANDVPHLCLNCGNEVKIDSRKEPKNCPECSSTNVVRTFRLEGVKCPNCDNGNFTRDTDFHRIS
jgi:DNA-directed RNA polymerase subunit RPC12/RpoP